MRVRLFFSALALTLLLLLPMVGLVEYFAMQRQMQERVRRANAAGTAVQVDPASRYMGSLLLAVQKEEPEFILLRMDAPADAFAAQGRPCVLAGFDLSKDAIRLAAKLLPEAAFAVGGSFSAPVRDGWADVLLNIFSPFAGQEFCRVLRSGGVLLYAVPTARHLYGLKEVLYDEPYENAEQQTEYSGFTLIGERTVTDTITVESDQIRNLFAMTPYFWKTPHAGALRLAAKQSLTTEIGFRFLAYRRV